MARVYELTDKGRGMEFKNQQKLVHGALLDGPRTAEQIGESIKAALVTRQAPSKVAQFYLSVWKKQGIVRVSNENGQASAPANVVKSDEPQEIEQLNTPTLNDGVEDLADAMIDAATPVPTETSSDESAAVDIESEESPNPEPETRELPALQQREDESNMSFVFRLVTQRPGIFPTDIEEITSGAMRKKTAADTLRRLQGAGHVARTDQGYRAVVNNPYTER
jgi:hypothetical protein